MQTFLPYATFRLSAEALDQRRLGKQRVETLQIMTALMENRGWIYHPAVRMWRGYERALLEYQSEICKVWIDRGHADTCFRKTSVLYFRNAIHRTGGIITPPWLGDPEFHLAHQSNLIRKDPEFYGDQFPGVPDDLPYIWPI